MIAEVLQQIQTELKAPKNQFNKFGGYNYRNCEDILEALKPILEKHKAAVIIIDDIVSIGNRFYVRATAQLHCGGEVLSSVAYAREPEARKGMDDAQVTGSSSSYARKYALNGLFAIDDTKDPDNNDNGEPGKKNDTAAKKDTEKVTQSINALCEKLSGAYGRTVNEIKKEACKTCGVRGETLGELKQIELILKAWSDNVDNNSQNT